MSATCPELRTHLDTLPRVQPARTATSPAGPLSPAAPTRRLSSGTDEANEYYLSLGLGEDMLYAGTNQGVIVAFCLAIDRDGGLSFHPRRSYGSAILSQGQPVDAIRVHPDRSSALAACLVGGMYVKLISTLTLEVVSTIPLSGSYVRSPRCLTWGGRNMLYAALTEGEVMAINTRDITTYLLLRESSAIIQVDADYNTEVVVVSTVARTVVRNPGDGQVRQVGSKPRAEGPFGACFSQGRVWCVRPSRRVFDADCFTGVVARTFKFPPEKFELETLMPTMVPLMPQDEPNVASDGGLMSPTRQPSLMPQFHTGALSIQDRLLVAIDMEHASWIGLTDNFPSAILDAVCIDHVAVCLCKGNHLTITTLGDPYRVVAAPARHLDATVGRGRNTGIGVIKVKKQRRSMRNAPMYSPGTTPTTANYVDSFQPPVGTSDSESSRSRRTPVHTSAHPGAGRDFSESDVENAGMSTTSQTRSSTDERRLARETSDGQVSSQQTSPAQRRGASQDHLNDGADRNAVVPDAAVADVADFPEVVTPPRMSPKGTAVTRGTKKASPVEEGVTDVVEAEAVCDDAIRGQYSEDDTVVASRDENDRDDDASPVNGPSNYGDNDEDVAKVDVAREEDRTDTEPEKPAANEPTTSTLLMKPVTPEPENRTPRSDKAAFCALTLQIYTSFRAMRHDIALASALRDELLRWWSNLKEFFHFQPTMEYVTSASWMTYATNDPDRTLPKESFARMKTMLFGTVELFLQQKDVLEDSWNPDLLQQNPHIVDCIKFLASPIVVEELGLEGHQLSPPNTAGDVIGSGSGGGCSGERCGSFGSSRGSGLGTSAAMATDILDRICKLVSRTHHLYPTLLSVILPRLQRPRRLPYFETDNGIPSRAAEETSLNGDDSEYDPESTWATGLYFADSEDKPKGVRLHRFDRKVLLGDHTLIDDLEFNPNSTVFIHYYLPYIFATLPSKAIQLAATNFPNVPALHVEHSLNPLIQARVRVNIAKAAPIEPEIDPGDTANILCDYYMLLFQMHDEAVISDDFTFYMAVKALLERRTAILDTIKHLTAAQRTSRSRENLLVARLESNISMLLQAKVSQGRLINKPTVQKMFVLFMKQYFLRGFFDIRREKEAIDTFVKEEKFDVLLDIFSLRTLPTKLVPSDMSSTSQGSTEQPLLVREQHWITLFSAANNHGCVFNAAVIALSVLHSSHAVVDLLLRALPDETVKKGSDVQETIEKIKQLATAAYPTQRK